MTERNSTILAGGIFLAVAVLINVPYGMLMGMFDYPMILRQPAGEVLRRFHDGGSRLVLTWWAFGILGLPLFYAVIGLHSLLHRKETPYLMTGTVFGLLALLAQLVGLLRWTFVVPVLANTYVDPASSPAAKEAAVVAFQALNQYGGVVIGEHIGQLFTILWMLLAGLAMRKSPAFRPWLGWLGIIGAAIYALAQFELFATVLPSVKEVPAAGLAGSLLWLLWMAVVGVFMIRRGKREGHA